MYRAIIPIVLLGGIASAATPLASPASEPATGDLDRALTGLSPGKPQDCIRQLDARSSRIYGNTVLFRVSSGLTYRNDTRGGCTNSGFQTAFQTSTTSNRLCAGDVGRTFDPTAGILTGSCTLGPFVPYRK